MIVQQIAYDSAMGPLLLGATEKGLCQLIFLDERKTAQLNLARQSDNPILSRSKNELEEYFSGNRTEFNIPLDLDVGTAFQKKVWQSLLQLKFGKVTSYKDQCTGIFGNGRGVRAVAQANGRNPIAILVPCHRVIASNGHLHGYASGLANKEMLLKLEGLHIQKGVVSS